MRSTLHGRVGLRGRLVGIASLSLIGCSAAIAADVKNVGGLMQFPNVVVISAPQAAPPVAPGQGGMRAYKDSPTGEYRGPTTEEMAEESQATAAASRRSTDVSSSSEAPSFAAAAGGVGVVLDDSSMVYSVLVRQADGSLVEVCVTGADAANAVITKQTVVKKADRGTSNVR